MSPPSRASSSSPRLPRSRASSSLPPSGAVVVALLAAACGAGPATKPPVPPAVASASAPACVAASTSASARASSSASASASAVAVPPPPYQGPTLVRVIKVPAGKSLSQTYDAPLDDVQDLPWSPLPTSVLEPSVITQPPRPQTALGWVTRPEGRALVLLGPVVAKSAGVAMAAEVFEETQIAPVRHVNGKVAYWAVYGSAHRCSGASAVALFDTTGAMIRFRLLPATPRELREIDLLAGRSVLEIRELEAFSGGGPERWTIYEIDDGSFKELASAHFGMGFGRPPPGSLTIVPGGAPRLVIRQPDEEYTPIDETMTCKGTERVLEWDPQGGRFKERSRTTIALPGRTGKR